MILSGKEIQKQVEMGTIKIDPFSQDLINPNSYNLRLHSDLLVYDNKILDMKEKNTASPLKIPDDGLLLEPNTLYLGRTIERTATDKYVPMLEGRSSVGRLGLFIHITAGFGDIGFDGFWTLEIFCVQPIKIYSGLEICQIFYHTIDGDYDLYKSKNIKATRVFSQASFTKILKNSNLVKILIFSLSLAYSQVDYKTQIEPIFYNKCSGCHTSGGSSGGLDLTSYNTLMAGGNSGASIVAGDHQNSLLWKRIDDGSMPPSSNDVSLSNVELVKKWINEGALATPQTSQNQAPSDFVWLSVESDTINISSTNLSNTFSLSWSESTDPDGDQVSYIVQAKIGNQTFDEIYDTTSQSVDISYQEFLDNVFESELAQSELVLFKVSATDGTDTVTVSGNDRKVLVDRSDLLSITSKSTPSSFKLYSNYPNPFNPNTKIPFDLYESSNVSIGIYNMLGQKVKSYFWSELHPGHHSVLWNGTDYYGDSVPAGVYMYQLKANNIVESKKMILLK